MNLLPSPAHPSLILLPCPHSSLMWWFTVTNSFPIIAANCRSVESDWRLISYCLPYSLIIVLNCDCGYIVMQRKIAEKRTYGCNCHCDVVAEDSAIAILWPQLWLGTTIWSHESNKLIKGLITHFLSYCYIEFVLALYWLCTVDCWLLI